MAAIGIWGVVATVFAAGAGGFLGRTAIGAIERRRAAEAALAADRQSRVLLRLKTGFMSARPLARKLLGVGIVSDACENVVQLAEAREIDTTKEALLSLVLVVVLVIVAVAGLITRSLVCGIALACVALIGANTFVRNKIERQSLAMREEIPEAMRAMGTCFRSGLSLLQTLRQTAKECPGTLGKLFGIAARRLDMGATPAEALSVMRTSAQVPELAFVSVALDVQHQSGGSIAPVLEAARDSVTSELDLMRNLRVQTAQAKLSAGIVTVMPFVLVALFSLMSPDFLSPFFQSLLGMGLLALALIMQFSGVLIVRRMLKIDAG